MSDWILENEGLESERLFNVHTNIEYMKISAGEWELGSPKEGFSISKYSDKAYRQLKSVLLGRDSASNRNSSVDELANKLVDMLEQSQIQSREQATLRDEFAMAALTSLAKEYHYSGDVYLKKLAEVSYRIADAMMEERVRNEHPTLQKDKVTQETSML